MNLHSNIIIKDRNKLSEAGAVASHKDFSLITWGSGGFLFLDIIESKANHSNTLVINRVSSESINDLGSILDLLDLGVGTNISTLDELLAVFAVECHLQDIEVSVVEADAGHLLILLKFIGLSCSGVFFAPLSCRRAIREVELDGLKGWLLEFV